MTRLFGPPRAERLAVAALAVVPLLPFLSAAVCIDAPVFLGVARQIAAHPADPFGFDMIWDPTSPHVAEFNHNPPLLSYYLAAWIAVLGDGERALHAALLPFPLLAALAFYGIARRLAGRGLGPAALLVVTPAFLVLATTLLLDVPLLAWLLCAVYALLRARETPGIGWQLAAGAAAAAAGLTKYAGFMSAPLLAAGLVWLPPAAAAQADPSRARWWAALRMVGIPVAAWSAWGGYTFVLYGAPHFAGGLALAGAKSFEPAAFWNQAVSVPIYYGAALLFPLLAWLGGARKFWHGAGLALLVGAFATLLVLPHGAPTRRVALGADQALLAASCFAGAAFVWGRGLRPAAGGEARFLALWLAGALVFSVCVNWHVNAADALLAAPPALLLLFRDSALRPGKRALSAWIAGMLAFSLLLAASDVQQRGIYRTAAREIAREIGAQPGRRWSVGQWGFQYYLEREGFHSVEPVQYAGSREASRLEVGDWVAAARNVSQLDVGGTLAGYRIQPVWSLSPPAWLPLRTTHADSGAGFYSHHGGYTPFLLWSRSPLDQIGLGRVVGVPEGGRR